MGDKFRPIDASLNDEATQTIELNELFTQDLTNTGSFDLRRSIWKTNFGRIIQALPIPTLIIDQSFRIRVANQAWGKISLNYDEMQDLLFSSLFPEASVSQRIQALLENVFSTRKPIIAQGKLEVGDLTIWARITFRSVRVMEERFVLILVEDLTSDKQLLEQNKKHREELERRVEERTSELMAANARLKDEVAERKRMEKALRESEQGFRTLVEQAPFGLLLINEDGTFAYINPKFKELFGYSLEDLPSGREWFRRAYPDPKYRHKVIATWIEDSTRVKTDQVRPRIFTVRCGDGSEKIVSFIPISLSSGKDMVTCEDITERRRTEELGIRTERLKAVGDLAAGVAHNFNNLLQMFSGGIDYALVDLETGNLPGLKMTLEELLQASILGGETVSRLQHFAQVRGEIDRHEAEVLDLSKTAKQAAEITKPFWKTGPDKEGIKVSLSLKLMDRCYVRAAESEIMEVLVNLLKNAAEALPTGGEIQVKTFFERGQAVLQVIDNGVGINKEHLRKVFEPFWSTKGPSAGTGMGLAVSHGIISRHGGSISVDSEQGKGTAFTVTLPLAKQPQEVPPLSGPKMLRSKLNILVIDDMAIIVMHLKGILMKHQHTVFSAKSGEEALEIFRNNKIDMVICDLSMPGMSGWHVGKAVRAICRERGLPKTPFILLTGWGGQDLEQEKIVESAVDAIVEKPIDGRKLIATLRKVAEIAD